MNEFDYGGIRWGVTFLRTTPRLSEVDRTSLMILATVMYLSDTDEMPIRTDDYEGSLFTNREYGLVGELGGRIYHAELETNSGKEKMSFLVNERTGGGGVFSKN